MDIPLTVMNLIFQDLYNSVVKHLGHKYHVGLHIDKGFQFSHSTTGELEIKGTFTLNEKRQ